MSSKVTRWVWDQDLPIQAKCVLLRLAERATDSGVCFPGQAEIRQKTGLSESMVRRYLHWLASDHDDHGGTRPPFVRIIQRPIAGDRNTSNVYVVLVPWANASDVQGELEELKHVPRVALKAVGCGGASQGGGSLGLHPVGVTHAPQVGGTGDTEEPSPPDPDRNSPPLPPSGVQQRQGERRTPGTTAAIDDTSQNVHSVQELIAAFCRGLGADATQLTVAMRRRDEVIAGQLVGAGATPAEAEAYAREASTASGRIAPVDLRSFERERLGWLARRRGTEQGRARLVDRTGQPPSWLGAPDGAMPVQSECALGHAGPVLSSSVERPAGLTGTGLGDALRRLLVNQPA
jgi:hypothetical protein